MPVQWTEDLAVGVAQIDRQHQGLFANVEELLAACREERGQESITGIITFLGNYLVKHFNTEEAAMVQSGYPEYEQHRAQHAQFIENFLELKSRYESGGPISGNIIMTNKIVVVWLKDHIHNVDKQLGAYLAMKPPA